MKKIIVSLCAVFLASAFLASAFLVACSGEKKEPAPAPRTDATASTALKPQTTCPVMGGKIDKKFFVDYQGKRVYFCCGDCPAEFNKDPDKYMKKLRDMGEEPEDVPANP
jgi:YHS domain-containing protein